jgi:hypothetical protein
MRRDLNSGLDVVVQAISLTLPAVLTAPFAMVPRWAVQLGLAIGADMLRVDTIQKSDSKKRRRQMGSAAVAP